MAIGISSALHAIELKSQEKRVTITETISAIKLEGQLFDGKTAGPGCARLEIEFIHRDAPISNFQPAARETDGMRVSSLDVGTATLTRTILLGKNGGPIVIHLLADKPGALSFKTRLIKNDLSHVEIVDRRQLLLRPPEISNSELASHLWVLPFEADVTSAEKSILLQGEGEALVIWNFSKPGELSSLAGTVEELARKYDPDQRPADPIKLWRGILADRLKSPEISP